LDGVFRKAIPAHGQRDNGGAAADGTGRTVTASFRVRPTPLVAWISPPLALAE